MPPAALQCSCIAVIGAGHVGACTAATIAQRCPAIKVLCYDKDKKKVAAWNSASLPLYEPGLKEMVEDCKRSNLHFTDDIARCVRDAQLIFVAVTTPLKASGIGAGEAPDVRYWEETARTIGALATEPKVIIERSTVPVRTASTMAKILRPPCSALRHEVISNPSFQPTGQAMVHMASPELVLIGGDKHTQAGRDAVEALRSVYLQWVPEHKIKTSDVWSAELSKLAANAFLAQRVSSMNAISAVCEASDADVTEVARAIGTDSRIGGKHLDAGIGFGGSCYPQHLRNLVYLCKAHDLFEVAAYWQTVLDMNEWQRNRFTEGIVKALFNTVSGKKLAVLGFAYKKDTSDTRESPARYVCRRLLDEGAELSVYDPRVPRAQIEADLGMVSNAHDVTPREGAAAAGPGKLSVETDAYTAAEGAHALLVLTDWDEFRALDYAKIRASMKRPCYAFDGRCVLDAVKLRDLGFQVQSVGRPAPPPSRYSTVESTPNVLAQLEHMSGPGSPLDY